jgi:hypothetical protein
MLDPEAFFDAVNEYSKNANNDESKGWTRCATVDSNYTGTGLVRVTFDGETTLSQKAYAFLDSPPRSGTRVLMLPIGATYVILGMVNGGI